MPTGRKSRAAISPRSARRAPASRSRLGGTSRHLLSKKGAQSDPQNRAQSHELVGPHGSLPVEDAPQALAVDPHAAGELHHADAAFPTRLLHPGGYEAKMGLRR